MARWADVKARSGLDKDRVESIRQQMAARQLPAFRSGVRAGEDYRAALRAVFEQAEREGR